MYVDHGNNDCCGEDFMAGTICSLALGHSGAHGTRCQVCRGDWYDQTCTCFARCEACGAAIEDYPTAPFCDDCCCMLQHEGSGNWCQLEASHHGACNFADYQWPPPPPSVAPTQEELAEVYKSLGVPMQ